MKTQTIVKSPGLRATLYFIYHSATPPTGNEIKEALSAPLKKAPVTVAAYLTALNKGRYIELSPTRPFTYTVTQKGKRFIDSSRETEDKGVRPTPTPATLTKNLKPTFASTLAKDVDNALAEAKSQKLLLDQTTKQLRTMKGILTILTKKVDAILEPFNAPGTDESPES